jgi:hypothetical protein
MRTILFALAFLAFGVGARAQSAEIVSNTTVGIEATKPADWQHLTAEANAANIRAVEMDDKEFQEAVAKYATAPIIAFTKYAEPYPDINPSFKINMRPSGSFAGRSASDVLAVVIPSLKKAFSDAVVKQGPTETIVSGLPAAYVQLDYTMSAGGMKFPTTSELWIVPRGNFFFMIGAGTRQDEATGTRAEIRSIIESLKILPQP